MPDMPTLKDFVSRDWVSLAPDSKISDAVTLFTDRSTSGAPVIDANGNMVGILTAKDCFRAALHASYYQGWSGIVADFMTREVQTLDADLDLVSAAQRFLETEFRRFPVVEDGRLLGILMRLDLLRALNTLGK